MLELFQEIQTRLVGAVGTDFKRFLHDRIDWKARLLALVGPRGVGKTTLLLQHIREAFTSPSQCLYLSADNIRVQAEGLFELANEFFRNGGELLVVDEAHRLPGWAAEIKSIYDSFPRARIAVSGSSMLDILKGRSDLSRRLVPYHLPGLSFREFLSIEKGTPFPAYSLDTILANHQRIAAETVAQAGGTILNHFRNYLDHGYYPFYLEGLDHFHIKLGNVVEKIVSEDIPSVFGIRPTSISTLKKLIYLVASSQPFVPNIERMAGNLQVSKEFVYNFIEYLRAAGLFSFLETPARGFKAVRKPHKVYLDNPNLYRTLLGTSGAAALRGPIRESFFLNQAQAVARLQADPKADFRTDSGLRFEVGGRSKGPAQLQGDEQAYLALDDLEVGSSRRIPLWMFGLVY